MSTRFNLFMAALALIALSFQPCLAASREKPNIIIVFADDLGYGDLSCYGHPSIKTPHLDRMAAEGMRFTDFYSAASVCTPSRAGLLTGRLPVRSGMASDRRRVLFPDSALGLPAEEITIAELLKEAGYATACIGKWHLGHLPEFLPTRNGFDTYFGIPYSNDMDRERSAPGGAAKSLAPKVEWWNVPLMRDEEIIERPADQTTITKRYTEEAITFIKGNKDRPFFIYLPHSMPHVPLFRSPDFEDHSLRGLYGDVIEEIDWSVGEILRTLRDENLDERTLVIFTSDNGPWLTQDLAGGSAGLLREGKGSTWEGGMREPGIAWWPGQIKAGSVSHEIASTLDLLPTAVALAGGKLPQDRVIDGVDLSPVLFGEGEADRDAYFFYRGAQLFAVRKGPFKAHFITQTGYRGGRAEHNPPLLFNVWQDPSEQHNLAEQHPEVLKEIEAAVERHRGQLEIKPTRLDARIGE